MTNKNVRILFSCPASSRETAEGLWLNLTGAVPDLKPVVSEDGNPHVLGSFHITDEIFNGLGETLKGSGFSFSWFAIEGHWSDWSRPYFASLQDIGNWFYNLGLTSQNPEDYARNHP